MGRIGDKLDITAFRRTPDSTVDAVEALRRRLGGFDKQQVEIWRQMTPARKGELIFQMYKFALETVRARVLQEDPDLSPEVLNWRVIRRMQSNLKLGGPSGSA